VRMVAVDHLIHLYRYDKIHFFISLVSALGCVLKDTMFGILIGGVISLLLFTDAMSIGHTELQLEKGKKLIATVDTRKFDSFSENILHTSDQEEQINKFVEDPQIDSEIVPLEEEIEEEVNNKEYIEEGYVEDFGDTIVYRIIGQLSYINSPAHEHRIEKILMDVGIKNIVFSFAYCLYMDLDGADILQEMITLSEAKGKFILLAGVRKSVKAQLKEHPFYQKMEKNGHVFLTYSEALDSLIENAEKKIDVSLQY